MKPLSLLVLAGVFAFAAAQNRLVFRDRKTNPRIQIEGNQGYFIPDKSFELTGNVVMKQIEDKLTMNCEKATGEFTKVSQKTEFNHVHLSGGVTVTQVGEAKSFGAKGSNAEYSFDSELRHLSIGGGVTLDFSGSTELKATSPSKGPTLRKSAMTVKASNAQVAFKKIAKDQKEAVEVQSATVEGPITFNGTQTDRTGEKSSNQKFSAKADHMTYLANGVSGQPEVKLTGNLEIHQTDDNGDGPDITGARSMTLELDAQFNIVKVRFSSEGVGQIKTVYTKTGKGGH